MDVGERFVRAAIKGDDAAFLQVMKLHKIDLYKTAFSFLHNKEEALEAIQEVTYRAYKNMKSIKEPAYFKTWLIRIMINYCNDQVNKMKHFVVNNEILEVHGSSENHTLMELKDAMLGLDDRSREVLTLKYFQDMKIKEIAEALQCPEGTVKTWLNKALKALREKLAGNGGDLHV